MSNGNVRRGEGVVQAACMHGLLLLRMPCVWLILLRHCAYVHGGMHIIADQSV